MKFLKFGISFLVFILFFLSGCNVISRSKIDTTPTPIPQTSTLKKNLAEIDLTTIKHTVSQGRIQDNGLRDENFKRLSVTDDLLANGKDSIPFLIGKLNDETKMDSQAMDFWYELYVGDIALIILTDFFTKEDAKTSTIPGFAWDEFLERGNDKAAMSEEILRRYIKKHGRKNIKERWQKLWDTQKENIFWNEKENCFDVKRVPT